jgi:multicomponent Na+:H+ antiporter subunit G
MSEMLRDIFMVVGATFLLLAALGIVRMPDLFSRMQSATKASTMGVGSIMVAAAFHFGDISVAARALAAIGFYFLTAPVTAHLIARASYFVGVPLWERSVVDELRGRYNPLTHDLESDTPREPTRYL